MRNVDKGAALFAAIVLAVALLTAGCAALDAAGKALPATQADIDRLNEDAAVLSERANSAAEAGDSIGTVLWGVGSGLASLAAAIGLSRRRRRAVIAQAVLAKTPPAS